MATLRDVIVADLQKALSGVVANTVTFRFGQIEQKFVRMFEEHSRGVNDEFYVHALRIRELTQRVDAFTAAAHANNTAVEKLGRSLAEAEKGVPRRPANAEACDRPTDGTVVRILCPAVVALETVADAIAATICEMDVGSGICAQIRRCGGACGEASWQVSGIAASTQRRVEIPRRAKQGLQTQQIVRGRRHTRCTATQEAT
jgi:hypothetical protein